MDVTKRLAHFAADLKFEVLPREVVEQAKLCLLDWLGAALAGSLEPPSRIIASIVRDMGGREESTVIGTDIKATSINASLANGVAGHAIELDDINEESIVHPAAPVMPAALAIAERDDLGGKDLLTAIVVGYEVENRIGRAMNPSHYQYWHATGTCGTFGAAAAAGRLLCLDGDGMARALGIAGTQAAGLIETFGTMSKPLNPGKAAMNGVIAALLAQRGFTAPSSILEAERGYFRAASREADPGKIVEGLGEGYQIMETIFKRHASCGHTHAPLDAVLEIAERYGVKAEDVEEVRVGTYPIAAELVGGNYVPKTPSEAKFSLPYCIAVALLYGRAGLGEFSPDKLADPRIRELSGKVKVHVDPEFAKVRLGSAKVELITKDGRAYSSRVDVPKGYPKNPMNRVELEAKFESLASLALTREEVKDVMRAVGSLERMDSVRELGELLLL
ncbi:MAG: MmgE/PrpD family protein [Candidatus Bathyarchaeia archaeon]